MVLLKCLVLKYHNFFLSSSSSCAFAVRDQPFWQSVNVSMDEYKVQKKKKKLRDLCSAASLLDGSK